MSMQDISDKELDQFFRNSAEEPNIPFDENAWGQLEQSLNKQARKNRYRKFRHSVAAVLAVYLLSTVSVRIPERSSDRISFSDFTYSKNSSARSNVSDSSVLPSNALQEQLISGVHPDLRQEEQTAAASDASPLEKNTSSAPYKSNRLKASVYTSIREATASNRLEKEKERKEHIRKYNAGESLAGIKQSNESNNHNLPLPDTSHQTLADKIAGSNSTPVLSHPVVFSDKHQPLAEVLSQETTNSNQTVNTEQIESKTTTDNSLLALSTDSTQKIIPADSLLPIAVQSTKDSTRKKDNTVFKRRFSFGIFASPDFSFTSSAQFVAPGLSAGIFAEYHVNTRWTIFAGVMRSSKIYSSNGSDYKATDKYWAYKGTTSRIDGSCAVLDVPVNVKYHFYNRNKNLLFGSAGISSYFMLHEKYSFVYSDGSSERSWSYTDKENYFFSLLNVSLGYERYIGKSFSVQVEPFIKLPINTLGEGKVKLLTTGMFFYLKYSIH